MSSKWANELGTLQEDQANISKRIKLLEEVIALEEEYAGGPAVAVERPSRTEVRPAISQVSVKSTTPSSKVVGNTKRIAKKMSKHISLPSIIEDIGLLHKNRSFNYKELAVIVKDSGKYKSTSKDFNNMVYQCLRKLEKRGIVKRNPETGEFCVVV